MNGLAQVFGEFFPLFIGNLVGPALGSSREDDFLLGQLSLLTVINDYCLNSSLCPRIFTDTICILSGQLD